MNPNEWIKTVTETTALFPYSSFDYLEGRPFNEVQFAGLDQFHVVDRALVNPYDAASVGLICHGGMNDYNGALPTFAYHLRVSKRANFVVSGRRPLTVSNMNDPEYIPGRWVYGGELMTHFGHFMAESSHRVYAVTERFNESSPAPAEGVVFSSRGSMNAFSRTLLCDYYGIPQDKVRVVNGRPAIVEQLEMRPQGSILGGSALSNEYIDFLNFYQAQNSSRITKQFPRKLFFGRAHLTTGGGGLEDENLLEAHLVNQGFASVRPEELPLLEQLEMLRRAEVVVGVGGSFVHLYDHLGSTDTALFLVSRGDPDAFYHDRTAQSKVASLEYYQPQTERGDVVTSSSDDGRIRSSTRYHIDSLLGAIDAFLDKRSA